MPDKGREQLRQAQAFLEMFARAWSAEYAAGGGNVYCARGCSACCTLMVNCTLTEAQLIAPGLDEEQAGRVRAYALRLAQLAGECGSDLKGFLQRQRREMGACPLLDREGSCSVYDLRPLSCRALLATRESRWCGADFGMMAAEEKQAFLAGLDQSVAAFPLHYAAATRDSGQELEQQELERMRQRYGCSLYGNLPLFVHLLREHGLSEALQNGAPAVEQVLLSSGLYHPLLMSFEADTP